jgi:CRISPR/Cas system-associated protein endoribonuclease Cas2
MESLVCFLDKETVRDYVQINNFKSWITKEGYNNVQFVVFVNGKESEKNQLVNLVKKNKLDMALWPTSNLVSSLGVMEYPTVYYIVNGVVVNTTNKLDQGHLKNLIGWCEHSKSTKANKAKDNSSMNENNKKMEENNTKKGMKEDKKMNDNKSNKKEKNCNCNCG